MSAKGTLEDIAAHVGWGEERKLELALEYLDEGQDWCSSWEAFLREKASKDLCAGVVCPQCGGLAVVNRFLDEGVEHICWDPECNFTWQSEE